MVFFPNEQLELWTSSDSTTEYDAYYEPKKEYTLTSTIPCDFQVMNTTEQLREFGELMTDTYKIYLPQDTTINPGMILRLKGKTDTYEIIGTPITNNHLPVVNHMKLVVKKQRKPQALVVNTE